MKAGDALVTWIESHPRTCIWIAVMVTVNFLVNLASLLVEVL